MLEIIKEAGTILKDLPDLAIWILMGILVYKTLIIGSIYGTIKLAINKLHDSFALKRQPVETVTKYSIDDRFIKHDGTLRRFKDLLDEMQSSSEVGSSNYIHRSDVDFLLEAIREKKERKNGKQ